MPECNMKEEPNFCKVYTVNNEIPFPPLLFSLLQTEAIEISGELSVHVKKGINSQSCIKYSEILKNSKILHTVSRYCVTCIIHHVDEC